MPTRNRADNTSAAGNAAAPHPASSRYAPAPASGPPAAPIHVGSGAFLSSEVMAEDPESIQKNQQS